MPYERPILATLLRRIAEPRRFIQILAGPRQVGKTTLATQAAALVRIPSHYASADGIAPPDAGWVGRQWEVARLASRQGDALLVLDEIQKVPGWSESVKALWDEDSRAAVPLRVVLLGSSPLLVQRGLTESLAGRFELIRLTHWSFPEMRDAFGIDLDHWIFSGGYPGAASLLDDEARWRDYMRDALVEPTLSRDILMLTRVDKPALLRRLFFLACGFSGQCLSYTKVMGHLQDAGNTTTLAHYLSLLESAGLVAGLPRYSGDVVRVRGSSPKFQVFDNALLSATTGTSFGVARADPAAWGRFVESAVGTHLLNGLQGTGFRLGWWREGNLEVDFVVDGKDRCLPIEVKSGHRPGSLAGLAAFEKRHRPFRSLVVGTGGVPLETFLSEPPVTWMG